MKTSELGQAIIDALQEADGLGNPGPFEGKLLSRGPVDGQALEITSLDDSETYYVLIYKVRR